MYLVTLDLEKLGEGCVVTNKSGNSFLDLSKVRCAGKGYKDTWELTFLVKPTKKETKTGKRILAVIESQTEEERSANVAPNYIGGGIVLFESSPSDSMPTAPPAPRAAVTPPVLDDEDLPF